MRQRLGFVIIMVLAVAATAFGPGRTLADITLVVVAASIVLHDVSVTPLMKRYSRT